MSYNGWTNYETWNVALWLDNDQGVQEYWNERAEECYRESEAGELYRSQTRAEAAAGKLADMLKAEHEEAMPELQGWAADILNAAFSEIDFHEIAAHYLADLDTAAIDKENDD
jgi:hypothetical protein